MTRKQLIAKVSGDCDVVFEARLAALKDAEDAVKEAAATCVQEEVSRAAEVVQQCASSLGRLESFPTEDVDVEGDERTGLAKVLDSLRYCERNGSAGYQGVVYEVMKYLESMGARPADLAGPQETPEGHFRLALDHLANAVESWDGHYYDQCHQYAVQCRSVLKQVGAQEDRRANDQFCLSRRRQS